MTGSKHRKRLKRRDTIRIELEPAAGDLPAIVLNVRPISAADVQLASLAVAAALGTAADGEEAKRRYGFEAGADIPLNLVALGEDGADTLLAVELGIRHIVSWEGLGGPEEDSDEPAPVTPEGVMLLLTDWNGRGRSYASIFLNQAAGRSILEPGAKKDSAVSPDTSSGEAARPATSAAPAEIPAPPVGGTP